MARKAKKGKAGKGRKRAPARKAPRKAKRTSQKSKPARKVVVKKAIQITAKLGSTPLKGQANLIVTFDPNHRGTAELELREVLRQAGEKPQIGQTEVEGLFKVAVSDSRKAVSKITTLRSNNPELFSVTHHFTPIDKWTQAEVPAMQKLIREVTSGIGKNEKWKLGLNKRHWDKLEGGPLIMKLTEVVDRLKVDLDNPDKIIQVEIIGKEAGISLLTPKDIIDVAKKDE